MISKIFKKANFKDVTVLGIIIFIVTVSLTNIKQSILTIFMY